MAGARTAAHARLPAAVPAGETRLVLDRPGYCSPASPTCRFAAGDDVLLAGPDGAFALAAVRAASPPLVIDLVAPLAQAWPAGTRVSVVEPRTYALRADAATGLRADRPQPGHGSGDAAGGLRAGVRGRVAGGWRGAGRAARAGRDARAHHLWAAAARGGRRRGSRAGPPARTASSPATPAGPAPPGWRRSAPVAVAAPLSRFVEGRGARLPRPPRAGTPIWREWWACGVRVEVAVASALLRPPFGAVMGPPAARRRLVPTLALSATAAVGRASGAP